MFLDWELVEKSQVLNLLIQVRTLFNSPDNWLFWPIALDANNQEANPISDQAVKWSLMGACEKYASTYAIPLSICVASAAREYLNDLSSDDLIHGRLDYQREIELLDVAIEELGKDDERISV